MGYASRSLLRAALPGLLLALLAQTARADGLRILLENAGPELSRAARTAFSNSSELRVAQDASLEATRGTEAQSVRARELARVEQVDIVVWWTGSELHTYDARADRLLGTRHAPSLPISSASAAALVLSIKALLQTTAELLPAEVETIAQPANRPMVTASEAQADLRTTPPIAAAAAGADAAVTPTAAAAPGTNASSEPRSLVTANAEAAPQPDLSESSGALTPPAAGASTVPGHSPPSAEKQPGFVVALQVGLAGMERVPGALFGVAAAGWVATSSIGIALRLESGQEAWLQRSRVDARLFDASLAADMVVRGPTWLALRIWGGVGPRLHLTRLQGSVGASVDTKRVVPGVGAVVHVECDISERWFMGAWASLGWLLVTQRYFVDGMLTHESSRQRAAFGVSLGLGFDRK